MPSLPVHPAEETQIQHGPTVAGIKNGQEPGVPRQRPDDDRVYLVVYDLPCRLVVNWADALVIAVDLVHVLVHLPRPMAREVEHQRVTWANAVHQPPQGCQDVVPSRDPTRV